VSPIDAGRLAGQIAGDVVMPGHHDYDLARRVWNGMIDRRPALIVRCTSAADVAAALDFASHAGLRVAVRGGSNNIAGNATVDDGLIIDLSPMQSVEVDIGARRPRAGRRSHLGCLRRGRPAGCGGPGRGRSRGRRDLQRRCSAVDRSAAASGRGRMLGVLLLVAAARGRPTTVTARPRHPRYEIGRSISIVTSGTHQINP
jgi:hypothetical protein